MALIGNKNVYLSCEIRAKPRLTALFWIIDENGTALAEGEVINGHWTLMTVCHFYPRDAMLTRVFATATCLSVRLSVRHAPVLCWHCHHLVAPRF